MPSILEAGNKATIDAVKAETPQTFTVGGSFDGARVDGGITYNRTWKNGWGATAYAKAWWNDSAVLPKDKHGIVVGGEVVKKFLFVLMVLAPVSAFAQPQALPGQLFKWDQPTTQVASIDRFEIKIDTGPYTPVGKVAANDAQTPAGQSSFSFPIPALTPGPHSYVVRACPLTGACSPDSPSFAFSMIVISAPSGLRITAPTP